MRKFIFIILLVFIFPITVSAEESWNEIPHEVATYNEYSDADNCYIFVAVKDDDIISHLISKGNARNQQGSELTTGITFKLNNSLDFYPMLVSQDSEGNINWQPELYNLAPGEYQFLISSLDAWRTAPNINCLDENNMIYGYATLTIGDIENSIELTLNKETVADKFGLGKDEISTVGLNDIRLGPQWVICSGTPTFHQGFLLIIPFVAAGLFKIRKKSCRY